MKLKTILFSLGLVAVTASASATVTIEDWGTLGSTAAVAKFDVVGTKSFDNVYSFSVAAGSTLDTYLSVFSARSSGITGGDLTLFSGSYTDLAHATSVVSFNASGVADQLTGPLAGGSYFYEFKGTGVKAGGTYDLEAFTTAVPEPASVALLMAGLGMMGYVARRRKG